jgi:opacity protein-like surface antigen
MATLPRLAALAALALVLAAPAASAHEVVNTADGQVRIVVGQLAEPVITFQKTGLDLCFTQNDVARTALANVNPGNLTATLAAPNGQTLSMALRGQHGRTGCFQFQEPYVPTMAGQYTVDVVGSVNGSAVDIRAVNAGGAVQDASDLTFPDSEVVDALALEAQVRALETRLAALERAGDDEENSIPSPAAALLIVGLAVLAALSRMR